ncbi:MAG: TlpA disulfide reductase family protein [Vicinamibacterales bacterium]|nr:TlpA disulfide reductase family protein [Vicinamibacterales bacterium]HJN45529.1 TlpA disulfide reductase family protein [Vicinamibacterales bacterium]
MRLELFVRWMPSSVALVLGMAACAPAPDTLSLAGRWDATIVVNDLEIPFAFEIADDGQTVQGTFFNGELRITSTGGRFDDDTLSLAFDQYATSIEASYANGQLEGRYERGARRSYPFHARPATPIEAASAEAPSIAGVWIIPTESSKGERAWRFIVRQVGGEVSGAILRVDGDTGNLTGSYRDGTFVMSHFSGARPLLLEVTLEDDGSLRLLQNRRRELVAVRSDSAAAAELPEPSDPSRHTTVADPDEPFHFSFPDLEGRIVTNGDQLFAGKVVVVNITGSWCPNCHDEAPFLSNLYNTYHGLGLEIVALSFEEEDQLANPTRLRAFIEKYDLDYTFLLAGVPEQLNEKVPQGVNLNAFPTTFILGRGGRVRAVHAGFPSPASGSFYTDVLDEVTSQIEALLAEPVEAA